ncbi:hypothetical protein SE15_05450 [Thermanaerothrix daxensis]|uniref:Uncharacterized protein n=1 Tax=Thermanaerothrix daxensis TaxID=869279 RepID=A0A0P6YNY0_9CHLR|nr:hypothetical protein [Thermanaerothrix daxensis]KPL84528.1 hypothetical protein SE15_05450 [Thermanaerothrix daxensis]
MGSESRSVYLFDLDGVLVQPGGYRQALRDTLNDWAARMGLSPAFAPSEEEIAILEAQGVTSEWDMIPFSLALIIEAWWDLHPGVVLSADLNQTLAIMRQATHHLVARPVFGQAYDGLGNKRIEGYPLVEGLLLQKDSPWVRERFPRLSHHPLLETLFSSTRDILRHLPNRDFQTRVLGSHLFEETYHTKAPFDSVPYLAVWDRVLVEKRILGELLHDEDGVGAVITARPSRPPLNPPRIRVGYSPEAEIAVELLGVKDLPIVGHGALTFMAEHMGIHAERLLKPSPFQAMAAIMAALTGDVLTGLLWAYQECGKSEWGKSAYLDRLILKQSMRSCHLPPHLNLHIFEDSPIGIRACQRAAEILREKGCRVDLYAWGISHQPTKIKALSELGAESFTNVNQALEVVLARRNHRKRAPVVGLDSSWESSST